MSPTNVLLVLTDQLRHPPTLGDWLRAKRRTPSTGAIPGYRPPARVQRH